MKIKFNDLHTQYVEIEDGLTKSFNQLFESSTYVNGPLVQQFEQQFANYIGTKFAIGVSNGTDAITLAIKALNLTGSTIIYIPANTFVATILGAERAMPKAKLQLIDCDHNYLIDIKKLQDSLKHTRRLYENSIIMPVHLYGKSCDMIEILNIAQQHESIVVEDAAQSHGSIIHNRRTGSFGSISAFSFYPGKNLGAMGDAGIVVTDCQDLYNRTKKLRNLGSDKKHVHDIKGMNHRLDSIQAAVLSEKLVKLDRWNQNRITVANYYINNIVNSKIVLPEPSKNLEHVYHIFCVRTENRNDLITYLQKHNIECGIHYPVPIEAMPMYSDLNAYNIKTREYSEHICSLPIHPFMSKSEMEYVVHTLNGF